MTKGNKTRDTLGWMKKQSLSLIRKTNKELKINVSTKTNTKR